MFRGRINNVMKPSIKISLWIIATTILAFIYCAYHEHANGFDAVLIVGFMFCGSVFLDISRSAPAQQPINKISPPRPNVIHPNYDITALNIPSPEDCVPISGNECYYMGKYGPVSVMSHPANTEIEDYFTGKCNYLMELFTPDQREGVEL